MTEFKKYINEIFLKLDFKKGDTILFVSDLTTILIQYKVENPINILNDIIDSLLDIIGDKGTLIIPTYNFDFCKGITYNYLKSSGHSGSLGNVALTRKDFVRTTNPIYSFAVAGKDKYKLYELKHTSCFGLDSPFNYLYKNKSKYFSIGVDIKDYGFTPCHYIEEQMQVSYRYLKNFTGNYIDKNANKKEVTYKFYVRDRSKSVRTGIKPIIDQILIDIKVYKKIMFKGCSYNVMNLNKAMDYLFENAKNNPEDERIIYPIRKGLFKRAKINTSRNILN